MSVVLEAGTIYLRGSSPVEDAEALLGLLQADPGYPVDVQAATGLHAAVVQVLLALRPRIMGPANDSFVNQWVLPIVTQRTTGMRN
jgi:hypothetical protein